jgi:YVTN family beta-propeller protein
VAWVVNHLSDDVSIVNLNTLHVRATLRVGDEPADVVFANGKAYVSVSQEDVVKVYDPGTLALLTTVAIDGRMRALARTADGTQVYVASFIAGNKTTVLSPAEVPPDSMPEDFDLPMDPGLPEPPNVGIIVNRVGANWYDMYGTLWTSKVPYNLYDVDVAEINHGHRPHAGGMSSTNFGSWPPQQPDVQTGTESRNILRFERGSRLSGRDQCLASTTTAPSRAPARPPRDYDGAGTQAGVAPIDPDRLARTGCARTSPRSAPASWRS